jgi:hypothetical protein
MDQPTNQNTVEDNNTIITGVESTKNDSSNTNPTENVPGIFFSIILRTNSGVRSYFLNLS